MVGKEKDVIMAIRGFVERHRAKIAAGLGAIAAVVAERLPLAEALRRLLEALSGSGGAQ